MHTTKARQWRDHQVHMVQYFWCLAIESASMSICLKIEFTQRCQVLGVKQSISTMFTHRPIPWLTPVLNY